MKKVREYLKQFENKYIDSLDDLFILFDSEKITFDQRKQLLKEVLNHNEQLYNKEKIKNKDVSKKIIISDNENVSSDILINHEEDRKQVKMLDVKSYIDLLMKCNSINEIERVLPASDSELYLEKINQILTDCYQYKVEVINFLNSNSDLNDEEVSEFKKEEELMQFIIETIRGILYEKGDNFLEIETSNKLIFQENGDRIISALKDIDREYYDSFKELLLSIKNGNFKRNRRFVNNNNINGIYEVKNFKTRILYDRIDTNTYVIIDAFVKKCDIDSRYRNRIQNSIQAYRKEEAILREKVKDANFLSKQKDIEEEVFELLDNSKKKVLTNE